MFLAASVSFSGAATLPGSPLGSDTYAYSYWNAFNELDIFLILTLYRYRPRIAKYFTTSVTWNGTFNSVLVKIINK